VQIDSAGQPFFGGDVFELIHENTENTEKRLKMSRYYEYKFDNWENCPFKGQIEVSATDRPTRETDFKIVEESSSRTRKAARPRVRISDQTIINYHLHLILETDLC
jgi:hypothetical protein